MSDIRLNEIEVQVNQIEAAIAKSDANLDALASKQSIEWPVSRVRSTFINYFVEKRQHTFWPSSPVVPVNDPTLLFANSGMNQFKPLFLGTCDPSLEMHNLKRACNSQKCIRAGGKHNDLEDVGKDVYHHTFFEMLGNWSFGCYFKEEAITWAWECLTSVYGLDPNRLYATYFGGDQKQGLAVDEEARQIWLRFLPAERILPFGCKDNFWEMGATGPCGPCTEIHYDRIGGRDASALVNADRPDVIEIWNNVFIQFNREADGSLKELPNKHVDTGMGLERLSSILQGKDSNYDTDIFMPIFDAIQRVAGCRPYQGLVGVEDKDLIDMAYRVVADHIRTLTFAITDGAVPGSDGRGYVLRRILRRAVRYGQEILGAPAGFFTSLVSIVVANFSDAFPELIGRQEFVRSVIADEEQSFIRTLDQGCKHFKKLVTTIQAAGTTIVPGKEAHFLFCSMGFPLDLTELMAAERGLTVDTAAFDELLERDRKISENAESMRKGLGSKDLSMEAEQTAWLQSNQVNPTDSSNKYAWNIAPECKVVAVFKGRGGSTAGFFESATPEDDLIGIVLDISPFYPEAGGQTFDTGDLLYNNDRTFTVENVQTYAGYTVHVGKLNHGPINVGDSVVARVDYTRRSFVAPNHTMTHVLNYALRKVLVDSNPDSSNMVGQCDQKGSLVDAEKLRFDFSWNSQLTSAQIAEAQEIVVNKIKSSANVYAEVVSLNSATQINALRKVFGERYPDPVRVISVGVPVAELIADPNNPEWRNSSIEFCGGTHLNNTAEAEDFVIVEESGIAKGVRRIVGLTRASAAAARQRAAALLERLSALEQMPGGAELNALSKSIKSEIDQAVVSLVDKEKMRAKQAVIAETLKQWFKANLAQRTASATSTVEVLANSAKSNNENWIFAELDFGADGKIAKKLQDKFKSLHSSSSNVIVSADDEGERICLYVCLSSEHVGAGLSAKSICEHAIGAFPGGKGGGKPDLANATFPSSVCGSTNLLDVVRSHIQSR